MTCSLNHPTSCLYFSYLKICPHSNCPGLRFTSQRYLIIERVFYNINRRRVLPFQLMLCGRFNFFLVLVYILAYGAFKKRKLNCRKETCPDMAWCRVVPFSYYASGLYGSSKVTCGFVYHNVSLGSRVCIFLGEGSIWS